MFLLTATLHNTDHIIYTCITLAIVAVTNGKIVSFSIDLKSTQDHLLMILNVLLNRKLVPTPHTLHNPLKQFAFTLCRLPLWHGLLITPPALKGEGVVSYKVLDEALKESEVCSLSLITKRSK